MTETKPKLQEAIVTKKGVRRLSLPKGTIVFFDKLGSENEPYNHIYDKEGNLLYENVHVAPKDAKFFDNSLQEI